MKHVHSSPVNVDVRCWAATILRTQHTLVVVEWRVQHVGCALHARGSNGAGHTRRRVPGVAKHARPRMGMICSIHVEMAPSYYSTSRIH